VERLCRALDERQKKVREAERWYSGDHPIPPPPPNSLAAYDGEARIAFDRMSKLAVTNFLGSVVDVKARKLRVESFHFGEGAPSTDNDVWEIWHRNHLSSEFGLSAKSALTTGQSYALVWIGSDGEHAEITLEDPSQAIVAYVPGTRRQRAAGLKRWIDDSGYRFVTLYLPDGIYKYRSARVFDPGTALMSGRRLDSDTAQVGMLYLPSSVPEWQPRIVKGEEWPLPNPLGKVTLVELTVNGPLRRPTFGGGQPQFQGQITDQKRINQTVLDMLITMEHQAFRQRWVVGWTPPIDPKTGEVDKHAALKAGAAALMIFGDERAKVGEFSQADFRPFIDAINMWVKAIASGSATPPYAFLLGDMINVAADSLARIEGQHADVLVGLQDELSDPVKEICLLALEVEGNAKAADTSLRPLWTEPAQPTATEQVEVARALKDLGAPDEAVFAALPGVDQQEAARWVRNRDADAFLTDAALDQGAA
jgi:hypothetical protein